MFRPAHTAVGSLLSSLGSSSNVMQPDTALFVAVSTAIIAPGDTTYLQIGEAPWTEVVRVTAFNAGILTIVRGIDGTLPGAFPAGTPVRYILAAEAVEAMIQAAIAALALPGSLTFQINAPNAVDVVGNNVIFAIAPANITSPDGSVDVTGSGNSIGVSVARGAFGCCEGS